MGVDYALGEARIVSSVVGGFHGLRTPSLLFFDNLEEGDRHQTLGRGDQWVASLIPFSVVFSRYDMEEISLVKC